MALFPFRFGNEDLASLPTAYFVASRQPFLYGRPTCLSLFAKACAILQALCWSWQHPQVPHFSSPLLRLCALLCLSLYLKVCDASGKNCLLSPILSRNNGSQHTHFFQVTMGLMSCRNRMHYFCLLQPFVVSLL